MSIGDDFVPTKTFQYLQYVTSQQICSARQFFVLYHSLMLSDVLEMQGVQLLVNIARNVVIVVAFGVSKVLDLSAIAAISLYAVNLSVFYILLIITILLLLERQVRLMERHS